MQSALPKKKCFCSTSDEGLKNRNMGDGKVTAYTSQKKIGPRVGWSNAVRVCHELQLAFSNTYQV